MGGVILVIPITFTIACRQKAHIMYLHFTLQEILVWTIREVYLQSSKNATQYFWIFFTKIFIQHNTKMT